MTTPPRFLILRLLAAGLVSGLTCLTAADAPTPIPYNGLSVSQTKQLDGLLKQKMAEEDPAVAEIFKAHPTFTILKPNSAIVPAPFDPTRHATIVERAKQGDIDLLFLGDSITDWWQTNGKNVYSQYFGNVKVADFAIAGDTTEGVLYRLQDGEGQGFQPKAVMLMIGTNNIGRNNAVEIADGVIADLNEIRKDFPEAKILLLGVFPRGLPNDPARKTIADINAIISKLGDGQNIFYLDIGSKFLGADGAFLPGTFLRDNLHPAEPGYKIWAEAVKDTLDSLLKGETPAPAK